MHLCSWGACSHSVLPPQPWLRNKAAKGPCRSTPQKHSLKHITGTLKDSFLVFKVNGIRGTQKLNHPALLCNFFNPTAVP